MRKITSSFFIPTIHSGIATPSVAGSMDPLITQGAVVMAAYSARQLLTGYAGPCGKLRGNGTGTPEADIPFTAGAQDKSAVAALIASGGGTAAFWKTWYEQSGNGVDATQTNGANQVNYSEVAFSCGAVGGVSQINCWLDSIDGSVLTRPFSIWMVLAMGSGGLQYDLLSVGSSGIYRTTSAFRRLTQNWGTTLAGTSTAITNLKTNILAVANGVSSATWISGVQKATGDSGVAALTGTMKIGAGPNTNLFTSTGGAIAEVIVFGDDPTALAGWADFVASAKSFFGTL